LEVPGAFDLGQTYSRREVVALATRGRARFAEMALTFHDLEIELLPENRRARVTLVARLRGVTTAGDPVDERRELECALRKQDGKWLLETCRASEILKR
jgi:hypothetical protein